MWKLYLFLSILGCFLVTILVANYVLDYSSAQITVAPMQNESREDPKKLFRVSISLFGVNDKTGYVLSFIKVNNVTAAKYFNATDNDLLDKDGIVDTLISVPNETVSKGSNFTACSLFLKDVTLSCKSGLYVPGRTQALQIVSPSYN
jgi:hypothetical protein